jgi:EGF domain-containing protein
MLITRFVPGASLLLAVAFVVLVSGCGQQAPPFDEQGSDTGSTDTDSDTDTDIDTDTDTDSPLDECADPLLNDCDTNATCTDLSVGYNCDCNSGYTGDGFTCTWVGFLTLTFQEKDWYSQDYEEHNILVGPASSTNPEDGYWTVIADGNDLVITSSDFVQGPLLDLSSWSGQDIRVAFYYTGDNADKWYIEDVCIGYSDLSTVPSSCPVFSDGFDSSTYPDLPSDWLAVSGVSDGDTDDWRTSSSEYVSSPTSATIDFGNNQDDYLVSPSITLP